MYHKCYLRKTNINKPGRNEGSLSAGFNMILLDFIGSNFLPRVHFYVDGFGGGQTLYFFQYVDHRMMYTLDICVCILI